MVLMSAVKKDAFPPTRGIDCTLDDPLREEEGRMREPSSLSDSVVRRASAGLDPYQIHASLPRPGINESNSHQGHHADSPPRSHRTPHLVPAKPARLWDNQWENRLTRLQDRWRGQRKIHKKITVIPAPGAINTCGRFCSLGGSKTPA